MLSISIGRAVSMRAIMSTKVTLPRPLPFVAALFLQACGATGAPVVSEPNSDLPSFIGPNDCGGCEPSGAGECTAYFPIAEGGGKDVPCDASCCA